MHVGMYLFALHFVRALVYLQYKCVCALMWDFCTLLAYTWLHMTNNLPILRNYGSPKCGFVQC